MTASFVWANFVRPYWTRTILCAVTAALLAALMMLGCSDDDGEGGGGARFGSTLNLNSRVYQDDSYFDGNTFRESYTAFSGNRTVTAGYYEYADWDWEEIFVPIGGNGGITNGQLNFTIGTPSYLENGAYFFEGLEYSYDNVNISSLVVNAVALNLKTPNGYLYREREIMTKYTPTQNAGIYEGVSYIYVDRDVTVSGRGKTNTYSDSNYSETFTTRNFTLNFKAGWNAVHFKAEWSETYNGNHYTYNGTETLSLSNPSNIRWIIWDDDDDYGDWDDNDDDDVSFVLGANQAWTDRFMYGVGEADGIIFYDDYTWDLIDGYSCGYNGQWGLCWSGDYYVSGRHAYLTDQFGDDYPPLVLSPNGNSLTADGWEVFRITNNVVITYFKTKQDKAFAEDSEPLVIYMAKRKQKLQKINNASESESVSSMSQAPLHKKSVHGGDLKKRTRRHETFRGIKRPGR